MGVIEVSELLDHGVLRRNVKIPYNGSEDLYFVSAIAPGFSDAHAHPQVVDVGEKGGWRHSYEWLENRKLRVNEAGIRRDKELSSLLTKATLLKSLMEGATLIAVTGSLEGNISAILSLPATPRVVVLPTVMDREGWSTPERVYAEHVKYLSRWDGYFNMGFFVHSLRKTGKSFLVASYKTAIKLGVPFAIHLSEGVDETESFIEVIGEPAGNVVAVHCLEGAEKCKRFGFKVVHCPTSNLYLYERTLRGLGLFDALGSDWPLVTGTIAKTYRDAVAVHGASYELLQKATLGGYRVFGMKTSGDIVAFDENLDKVMRGELKPRAVVVNGRLVVYENVMIDLNLSSQDIEKVKEQAVRLAFEQYGI
ncbi:MAG: amidohydrolase family protein [Infirmifilum sp.]|jgi:guanine deaminase|uniref:amidohydrolase family protein n=1 Tax=Infirmifilum TaxID=2856573 RepID=UPI002354F165